MTEGPRVRLSGPREVNGKLLPNVSGVYCSGGLFLMQAGSFGADVCKPSMDSEVQEPTELASFLLIERGNEVGVEDSLRRAIQIKPGFTPKVPKQRTEYFTLMPQFPHLMPSP